MWNIAFCKIMKKINYALPNKRAMQFSMELSELRERKRHVFSPHQSHTNDSSMIYIQYFYLYHDSGRWNCNFYQNLLTNFAHHSNYMLFQTRCQTLLAAYVNLLEEMCRKQETMENYNYFYYRLSTQDTAAQRRVLVLTTSLLKM
jgi:hypothetical protein